LRNPFASTDFEREQWRTRIDEEIQRINTDTSPSARLVRPPIGSRVAASSIVQHKRYVVVRARFRYVALDLMRIHDTSAARAVSMMHKSSCRRFKSGKGRSP
jgi:hypothetical protein